MKKQVRNLWNDKRGVFPFMLLFVVLIIIFFIILIKAPEICLFGGCWRLIPLKLSKGFMFWLTFATWILIQVAFVFVCVEVVVKGSKGLTNLISNIKKWTLNFEQFVMHHL